MCRPIHKLIVGCCLCLLVRCSDDGQVPPDAGAPDTLPHDAVQADLPDSTRTDLPLPDAPPADAPAADAPLDTGPLAPPGVWVTAKQGTFQMGSPASEPCRNLWAGSKETQHGVTLTRSFEIQTTEVTQTQFKAVMGYSPAPPSNCPACPVHQVTWHEAVAYCNALSKLAGSTPCYACSGGGALITCQEATAYGGAKIYTCPGYRLPTEAEWEHAYRAGTKTAYYSGSNDPSTCQSCTQVDNNAAAIGQYCVKPQLLAVGQKQPNSLGLHDMAGNVFEWCHDWYLGDLGSAAATDPWGPATGTTRVVRGGTYIWYAETLRAAWRFGYPPTMRAAGGFRCVRTK